MPEITREEILRSGMTRLELAEKMRLSYTLLTNKILGYVNWQDGELERAKEILKKEGS